MTTTVLNSTSPTLTSTLIFTAQSQHNGKVLKCEGVAQGIRGVQGKSIMIKVDTTSELWLLVN